MMGNSNSSELKKIQTEIQKKEDERNHREEMERQRAKLELKKIQTEIQKKEDERNHREEMERQRAKLESLNETDEEREISQQTTNNTIEMKQKERENDMIKKMLDAGGDYLYRENDQNKLLEENDYMDGIKKSLNKSSPTSVLLLGMVQSGKSCFIGSLHTIMEKRFTNYIIRGEAESSSTIGLTENKFKEEKLQSISIWDIAGFQEQQTDAIMTITNDGLVEHIRQVIEGRIGETLYTKGLPDGKDNEVDDNIKKDCIAFVCRAKDVDHRLTQKAEVAEFKTAWNDIIRIIKECGLSAVVVLTGCDEISESVRQTPDVILRSRRVMDAKKKAAKFFEVSETNVFPVVNYTNQTGVDEKLHKPMLDAFYKMIMSAKDHKLKLNNMQNTE